MGKERCKKAPVITERGSIILFMMVLMGVLLSLGLIAMDITVSEMGLTAKDIRSIRTLYYAEAGLERAIRHLRDIRDGSNPTFSNWSDVLDGVDNSQGNSDDGVLGFGATVSFNGGSYSVLVTDNNDGDTDPYIDSDNIVIITSTGAVPSGESRVITVEVSSNPLAPGATVYLHGPSSEVAQEEDLFLVSGDNYNIGEATPTVVGAYYAVSTSAPSLIVADSYKDNFKGKGYDPGPIPPVPSIKTSSATEDVQSLINYYSSYADYVLGGGTYTQAYGSSTNYKIVYSTGNIVLSGNKSGYGLLVSEGSVELRGVYTWTGVIIARDEVKFSGPDNQEVKLYGAVYVGNSSGADVKPELEVGGKAALLFSAQAINRTNRALPLKINFWKVN